MRIIINGFHDDNHIKILNDYFKKRSNVHYVYYICNKQSSLLGNKIEFQYLHWRDAASARYDLSLCRPLDEKIVERYHHCESTVLKMMDRHESIRHLSYDDRISLYYIHLRYWLDIIERNKIDYFISSNIPHESYDFIIYSICKKKGIETLFTHQGPVSDTFFYMKDWRRFMPGLGEKKIEEDVNFNPNIETFISNQIRNSSKSIPFYMKKEPLLKENVLSKFKIKVLKNLFLYIKRYELEIEKSTLNQYYDNSTTQVNLNNPFLYYPLHYQPELTTSPLGGFFVHQLMVVQMLDYYLPDEILIYIKEHPKQGVIGRNLSFYRELKKINRVRFIHKSEDSFSLINNSIAVVTVTGTAGLEALFREKPVFLFGNIYYQYANGVYPIKSNRDCVHAIDEVIKNGKHPNKEDIIDFMEKYQMNVIDGYVNNYYSSISNYTEEENNYKIINFLDETIGEKNV